MYKITILANGRVLSGTIADAMMLAGPGSQIFYQSNDNPNVFDVRVDGINVATCHRMAENTMVYPTVDELLENMGDDWD